MEILMHRGYHGNDILENTRSAFQKSLDVNRGFEFDVRLTRDRQVIVFHDATLERLFNIQVAVADVTYDALCEYTKGDAQILLLSEVLEMVQGRVPLLIELKSDKYRKDLCSKVSQLLDSYEGAFQVESFDPIIVRWFKMHRPHFSRGQLLMPVSLYRPRIFGFIGFGFSKWITKPDFYAYHYKIGSSALGRAYYRWLAKGHPIYIWTLKPGITVHFNASALIVEE